MTARGTACITEHRLSTLLINLLIKSYNRITRRDQLVDV